MVLNVSLWPLWWFNLWNYCQSEKCINQFMLWLVSASDLWCQGSSASSGLFLAIIKVGCRDWEINLTMFVSRHWTVMYLHTVYKLCKIRKQLNVVNLKIACVSSLLNIQNMHLSYFSNFFHLHINMLKVCIEKVPVNLLFLNSLSLLGN